MSSNATPSGPDDPRAAERGAPLRLALLAAGAFGASAAAALGVIALSAGMPGCAPQDEGLAVLPDSGARMDAEVRSGEARVRGLLDQAGLDEGLAASLGKADGDMPQEGPNAGVLTFRKLSLAGTDMGLLLDRLFGLPEEVELLPPYEFPEPILALDGQEIELLGYMIATEWADARVTEFMLVMDTGACCYGGIPRPDEWALVTMAEGQSSEHHAYVPIVVKGVLTILPPGSDPDMPAVYTLLGKSVRTYY